MGKKEFHSDLYKKLYTIRAFENQGVKLYRHGEIYGYTAYPKGCVVSVEVIE